MLDIGSRSGVEEYYATLENELKGVSQQSSYSYGDALHGIPGCDASLSTGYSDTIGSYGVMFDVTSLVPMEDDTGVNGVAVDPMSKYAEIYGMDVYIRNIVNTSIEVYVRAIDSGDGSESKKYSTYYEPTGQTAIAKNWELVAKGIVEGKGPDVGTPIPPETWLQNVIVEPGHNVGLYVTLLGAPDLRYRNSSLAEGVIFSSDGILGVGVGRSWGQYPLEDGKSRARLMIRGCVCNLFFVFSFVPFFLLSNFSLDGSDVYFSGREFSGAFHYHAHEGICKSVAPSAAPSSLTSLPPTPAVSTGPRDDGLCESESTLATTFQDGTGSFGALFDVLAKTEVTLTGIDLNVRPEGAGN